MEANRPVDLITASTYITSHAQAFNTDILDGFVDTSIPGHTAEHIDQLITKKFKLDNAAYMEDVLGSMRNGGGKQELLELCGNVVEHFGDIQDELADKENSIIRFSDLEAYTPSEGETLAGKGWLKKGSSCIITGGTGIGKSILIDQLALCLASGSPWLESLAIPKPSRVLHIQAENDMDDMKKSMTSIRDYLEIPRKQLEENLAMRHIFDVEGSELAAALTPSIRSEQPDVVIIDNYQAYLGAQDINSTSSFRAFIRPLDALKNTYNFSLILICHTPKPREQDYTKRQSVYLAAGTAAIANWARTSAELTPTSEDSRYRLRFGKNAERTDLYNTFGELMRDLYVEHSGLRDCPYWKVSPSQESDTQKPQLHEDIIQSRLNNKDWPYRKIAETLHTSKSTVERVLKQANLDLNI